MVEIVAEMSGNHGGSLEKALSLIVEAAHVGCDYVKFQYYLPEDMPDLNEGNNQEMYGKLYVPPKWLPKLFHTARQCHIGLFASVFSVRAAKEILEYDVPFIKLASPDSTKLAHDVYDGIIELIPPDVDLIVSRPAFDHFELAAPAMLVLYCPPGHPPTITVDALYEFRSSTYYGFSDHTPGIRAPLAFIRAGADMIEKHFKLEYDDLTYEKLPVDAAFSADPSTMKTLCRLAHNR